MINNALDELLSGKQCNKIEIHSRIPQLQKTINKINLLIHDLNEMNLLAGELSQGKLDVDIPRRHNFMAGSLKNLHSKLSTFAWSLRQLRAGYVINKPEDTGELFSALSDMIDQISEISMKETNGMASINSWRYHQILHTIDMLHIMVLEVNSSGHIVYANRSAKERLGEIENINLHQNDSKVLTLIATNKEEEYFPVIRDIYEEVQNVWYRVTTDRFQAPNGQAFFFNTIEDISEWKFNEHRLKMSASIDAMTGAYNRKAGIEKLEQLLTCINPSESYCVAFIDIDGLKNINDKYGHSEGDYTIKKIAKILLTFIRDSDFVCRYGGDEFFIIFKNCAEPSAENIIKRMYEKLTIMNQNSLKPYILSFSYGIVPFCDCCLKSTDLLKLADQRMYLEKNRKKIGLRKEITLNE